NCQIYVLDKTQSPQPQGIPGELYIGGAGVARGYLNRPELTAEKFIRDPFSADPAARLYRTGDLARWLPDGNLEFIGRIDEQVKIRGFRIELGEIESRLLEHAGVTSCVVLAREDVPGEKQLVAYVVLAESLEDYQRELRAYLQGVLPEYMVPSAYVQLEAIPLTPNGKVNRKGLPAPGAGSYVQEAYVAPRSETERVLVEIWSGLLRLKPEEISITANFFALGGHSLLVMQLMSRLQQQGLQTDMRSVFEAPTVEGLAAVIDGSLPAPVYEVPANRIPADCERITPELLTLVTLSQEEIDR